MVFISLLAYNKTFSSYEAQKYAFFLVATK